VGYIHYDGQTYFDVQDKYERGRILGTKEGQLAAHSRQRKLTEVFSSSRAARRLKERIVRSMLDSGCHDERQRQNLETSLHNSCRHFFASHPEQTDDDASTNSEDLDDIDNRVM
jgi:hypothetical protein